MNTITVEMPNRTMTVDKPIWIGRFFVVYSKAHSRRVVTTCIDEADGKPKRMRVQCQGDIQGEVLQPHEYEIVEKDAQFED